MEPGDGYAVGIDVGTTYTAAAVARRGRLAMVELGKRATVVPSVVLVRADGSEVVGDAAEHRALSEPERVAREFKRRLGDQVPLLLGGEAHTAEAIAGRLLGWTLRTVAAAQGGPPAAVVLTHPASWGAYKLEVLARIAASVGLDGTGPALRFLPEPVAAAMTYAAEARPPDGAHLAVYDLGGGTFDATVVRGDGGEFTVLGAPGGLEHLGGVDFDEALAAHVLGQLPGVSDLLLDAGTDPGIAADVARVRRACVEAKELLSVDLDTSIDVRIGTARHEIRVLRAEFEALIEPALAATIDALERTVAGAGLDVGDLHAVLLVGGSSRIPHVAELLQRHLGRPVAVDAHPKFGVALGAALAAAGLNPASGRLAAPPPPEPPALPAPPALLSPHPPALLSPHPPAPAPQVLLGPPAEAAASTRPAAPPGPAPSAGPPPGPAGRARPGVPDALRVGPPPQAPPAATPVAPAPPPLRGPHAAEGVPQELVAAPPLRSSASQRKRLASAAAGALFGAAVLGGGIVLNARDDSGGTATTTTAAPATNSTRAPASTGGPGTTTGTSATDTTDGTTTATAVTAAAADRERVADWLRFSNTTGSVLLAASGTEEIGPRCGQAVAQAGERFGALTGGDGVPRLPDELSALLPRLPPEYQGPFARLVDADVRRWEACAAGDFSQDEALRAQAAAARDELLRLVEGTAATGGSG